MIQQNASVRLQKFMADCGVASRRKCEEFITAGRVRVNGSITAVLGTRIDPQRDHVEFDGRSLTPELRGVLLLNKPRGVVSTKSDPEGRETVMDLLPKRFASYFPVGRLDYDSSGLVVMTNDGDFAERLMHPRYEVDRLYRVRVEGVITEPTLVKLAEGVRLEDGVVTCDTKFLRSDGKSSWLEVSIRSGRNRVLRRLFESIGHPVVKLVRLAHGPFALGKLASGDFRALSNDDYQKVRRSVLGPRADKS